ncbi:hypothetical protein [Lysinibacillus piscis]|uniref:Host cell surface-exposed lipoprotein Ltp-like HTH region domain-containing protein n=1 Tax=Lysinibacillus piscis TaxID=2518931 RepID=A0ABQ5NGI8_9BACI|nr:hypothetical protein [Lysinibacillus sp. KH24]GLC87492.1 hypothetical protein LYSBPC_06190 [Lysinibacillus sp. KH24]
MTQETTNKPKQNNKFSKAAFLASALSTKERLEYEVVLQEGMAYTKAEAEKALAAWKKKGIEV